MNIDITEILINSFTQVAELLKPMLIEIFISAFPIFAIFFAVKIAMLVFKKMSEPDDFDVDDYVNEMYQFALDNHIESDELEEYFRDGFNDFDEKYDDYIDRNEIDFILEYDDHHDDYDDFDDNFYSEMIDDYEDYYNSLIEDYDDYY